MVWTDVWMGGAKHSNAGNASFFWIGVRYPWEDYKVLNYCVELNFKHILILRLNENKFTQPAVFHKDVIRCVFITINC